MPILRYLTPGRVILSRIRVAPAQQSTFCPSSFDAMRRKSLTILHYFFTEMPSSTIFQSWSATLHDVKIQTIFKLSF